MKVYVDNVWEANLIELQNIKSYNDYFSSTDDYQRTQQIYLDKVIMKQNE